MSLKRRKSTLSLPAPSEGQPELAEVKEELTVGEQLKEIGWGRYQVQAFLFCQGVLMCESAQLSSISGVKTMIYAEFNLKTDEEQSHLMLLLFLGFMIGTIACGTVGDWKGRRLPMALGAIGMVASQLGIHFVTYLPLFYALIWFLGFFAGFGIPAAVTFMSEVAPDNVRGVFGAALCLGFCSGELWSAIGLRIFIPTLDSGPWRYVMFWAIIPPASLVFCGMSMSVARYDSPHFLAVHNKVKELRGVMNLMAQMNGRPELVHDIASEKAASEEEEEEETPVTFFEAVKTLSHGRMGLHTFVLIVLFLAYNLGYYGTIDFFPIGWQKLNMKSMDKATELILTALIGMVSVPIAVWTMTRVPRRVGCCFFGLLCAVAALCLIGLVKDQLIIGWIGVIVFKSTWMSFEMITINLPGEIYPTRVSVWGWSMVCFIGRIASLMAPIIISNSNTAYLVGLAAILGLSAVLVWLLPETKDVDLEALDSHDHEVHAKGNINKSVPDKSYGSFGDIQPEARAV